MYLREKNKKKKKEISQQYTSNSIFSLKNARCRRVIIIVSMMGGGWGPSASISLAVTIFPFEETTNFTPKLELNKSRKRKLLQIKRSTI